MSLKPRSQAHVRTYWIAYAVLAASLCLTFAAFFGHARYIATRDQARFAQAGMAAFEQVEAQIEVFLTMMKGLRALFAANPGISPAEIERYFRVLRMEDLQQEKGLEGVGIIAAVPSDRQAEHTAWMRTRFPDYALNTAVTNGTAYPIIYLEKLGKGMDKAPLGWDVGKDPIRRETLERCRTNRQPAVTGKTHLLYADQTEGATGFIIYLPIFTRLPKDAESEPHLAGFIFSAFDSAKLWRNLFRGQPDEIEIEIYDGEAKTENLLFDRDQTPHLARLEKPRFEGSICADFYGRRWTFFFHSLPQSAGLFEQALPYVLLALGVAGSFFLSGFVFVQARSRKNTERLSRTLRESEQTVRLANDELARQVTEAKSAAERLRESEALYHSLVQTLPQCVFRKDLDGRFTFGNSAFCSVFHVRGDELPGKTDFDFFPAPLAEKYRADDRRIIETNQAFHSVESYFAAPGQMRVLQVVKTPLLDAQGRVSGIQGVFWDITENKAAEERVAAEKERLAVTLRAISDAVVATDLEGRIQLMNPVAEQMVELSQNRAEGRQVSDIFVLHDPQSRKMASEFARAFPAGKPGTSKTAILKAPSGKEILVQKRAAPIHDGDGVVTGVVLVYRDITQERKIDEELLRASKLESIGLLAGGIAHDFNNVLTGIVGNLSLLRETPGLPPEVAQRMELLEKTAYKARQLTLQLLTFAKGGSPIKQTASMAEVIRESAEFALRGSNVRPEFHFKEDLATVEIDTGQMSQVVQNLVINAKQAMPNGGVIRLSAQNFEVDQKTNLPLPAGSYVRVAIADNGAGIKPENLSRIFDPYFTTKSSGTGLGLATAYSVLKRHNGLITVESEWGVGTTFHLYVPSSTAKPPSETPRMFRDMRGTGRILAMDDEPAIRSLLSEIFTHFGYAGTVVSDGQEAVREYQKAAADGQPYDAVIMDLTVPGGMGGKEALSRMLAIDPNVRAIVSSGYSNDPVLAEYQKHGFIARVEKPYNLNEIAAVLQTVLHRNGALRPALNASDRNS